MGVAESAVAALGEHQPLAGLGQVGDQGLAVLVQDLGADGHLDDDAAPLGAAPIAPGAVPSAAGLEMLGVAKIDEGVEVGHDLDDDVAAAPAVAAVGAAERNELLAAKGHRTGAAVTAFDVNLGFVEKLHPSWSVRPSVNEGGERH